MKKINLKEILKILINIINKKKKKMYYILIFLFEMLFLDKNRNKMFRIKY